MAITLALSGSQKKTLRELGGLFIAVGGVWMGLVGLHGKVSFILAMTLFGIGIAISVLGWVFPVLHSTNYFPRALTENEMAELFVFLSEFGPTSPLPIKLKVLAKNQQCFTALERIKNRTKTLVGYCITYRLTSIAVRHLLSRDLIGINVGPKDIVSQHNIPRGLYVSFLWGENKRARGEVLRILDSDLRAILSKQEVLLVFARAATKDSLRLLKKHRFTSLDPTNVGIGSLAYREFRRSELEGTRMEAVLRGRLQKKPLEGRQLESG